jgi:hypothetical protein
VRARAAGTALLLLLAVLLAGCGVPRDEAPRALDRDAAPFRLFEDAPSPAPAGDVVVELWLVRGDRIVPSRRALQQPGSPQQVLRALFAGLTEEERAAGLSTAIPATIELTGVEVNEGIAVVTLQGVNEQVQVLAFAQIVATLDGRPEVMAVRFRDAERDLPVPRGDGSVSGAPVTRQSYLEVLGLDVGGTVPTAPPSAEPPPAPDGGEPPPAG